MLKIRLWGETREINNFVAHISADKCVRVLSMSKNYPDRGSSIYERCYMEIEQVPGNGQVKLLRGADDE